MLTHINTSGSASATQATRKNDVKHAVVIVLFINLEKQKMHNSLAALALCRPHHSWNTQAKGGGGVFSSKSK